MGKSSTVKPVQCFLCKGRQLQGTCEWFADPGWTPEGGLFEPSWLSGSGSRWPTWQIWLEGWCFPWNPRGCSRKPPSESVSSRSWRSWHWDGLCSNIWPIESPGLQPTGFFLRKKWARERWNNKNSPVPGDPDNCGMLCCRIASLIWNQTYGCNCQENQKYHNNRFYPLMLGRINSIQNSIFCDFYSNLYFVTFSLSGFSIPILSTPMNSYP